MKIYKHLTVIKIADSFKKTLLLKYTYSSQLLTGQPGTRTSGQGLIHQGKVPQTESMEV